MLMTAGTYMAVVLSNPPQTSIEPYLHFRDRLKSISFLQGNEFVIDAISRLAAGGFFKSFENGSATTITTIISDTPLNLHDSGALLSLRDTGLCRILLQPTTTTANAIITTTTITTETVSSIGVIGTEAVPIFNYIELTKRANRHRFIRPQHWCFSPRTKTTVGRTNRNICCTSIYRSGTLTVTCRQWNFISAV